MNALYIYIYIYIYILRGVFLEFVSRKTKYVEDVNIQVFYAFEYKKVKIFPL